MIVKNRKSDLQKEFEKNQIELENLLLQLRLLEKILKEKGMLSS